eukprot:6411335-Prymnesium_polylepis.1
MTDPRPVPAPACVGARPLRRRDRASVHRGVRRGAARRRLVGQQNRGALVDGWRRDVVGRGVRRRL